MGRRQPQASALADWAGDVAADVGEVGDPGLGDVQVGLGGAAGDQLQVAAPLGDGWLGGFLGDGTVSLSAIEGHIWTACCASDRSQCGTGMSGKTGEPWPSSCTSSGTPDLPAADGQALVLDTAPPGGPPGPSGGLRVRP